MAPLQLLALPFNILLYALSSALSFLSRLTGVRPNLPSFSLRPLFSQSPSRINARLDPRSAAQAFVNALEEETGNAQSYATLATGVESSSSKASSIPSSQHSNLPDFHIGSYDSALSLAKEKMQPLCVILISSEHQDAELFKKTTLCDSELISTLKSKNFVVWGGDVRYRDAYQTSQILEATTYPFIAFITLQPPRSRPGMSAPSTSAAKMTLFSRLEGSPNTTTSAKNIVTHINSVFLPRTSSYLDRIKRERQSREQERRLREEQDRAYAEAGRKDVERIRAKQAKLEEAKKQARELEQQKEREANRSALVEQWRNWARGNLVPKEAGADDGHTSRLTVRLPDGRRFAGKFTDQTTMEQIYAWIDCQAFSSSSSSTRIETTKPTSYQHVYDFKLVTLYPKRILTFEESKGINLVEAGLTPNGSLLAEGMALSKDAGESSDEDVEE